METPQERLNKLYKELVHKDVVQTKRAFATLLGYDMSYVSQLMNGKRELTERICQRMLEKTGVSPEWLLTGKGDMFINTDLNHPQSFGNQNNKPVSSTSPLRNDAVIIGSFDIDDETMKTKSGNEFIDYGNGNYVMVIPLVTEYAYGGYLLGYRDQEYMENLPKTYLPVSELHKGVYRSFEARNDSMDDRSSQAIEHGDTVVGRLINQNLYSNSKLHLKKYPDYIIVHKDGIIVKRIIDHNPATGEIVIHSLNPDKELYPDETLNLRDVLQLFNVTNVMKSRR